MSAASIVKEVAGLQPRLKCSLGTDSVEFTGSFVLNSPIGSFDSFSIRLLVSLLFPQKEPRVWEVGGRLPRDIDRHVYPDGECCITVWESWLIGAESVTVADFVEGPLFNFFLAQHQVENGQKWPFGEWKHGVRGRIDALAQSLNLPPDDLLIVRFLLAIAEPDLRKTDDCPCGSGRRVGRCHQVVIHHARERIGQTRLISIAREIMDSRLKSEKRVQATAKIAALVQLPTYDLSPKSSLLSGGSLLAVAKMLARTTNGSG